MADKWVAECIPCKWEQHFDDENGAIIAAEFHVIEHHRDKSPEVRGAEKMGHVQMRTVQGGDDTATSGSLSMRHLQTSDAPVIPAAPSSSVAAAGEVTLTTPKGETITVKE